MRAILLCQLRGSANCSMTSALSRNQWLRQSLMPSKFQGVGAPTAAAPTGRANSNLLRGLSHDVEHLHSALIHTLPSCLLEC